MHPQRDFKLTECKSYSNGSVGLRYERMRTTMWGIRGTPRLIAVGAV